MSTSLDNMRDMAKKDRWNNQNRNAEICKQGHPFNEKNTYYVKTRGREGNRACRICKNIVQKRSYKKLREIKNGN